MTRRSKHRLFLNPREGCGPLTYFLIRHNSRESDSMCRRYLTLKKLRPALNLLRVKTAEPCRLIKSQHRAQSARIVVGNRASCPCESSDASVRGKAQSTNYNLSWHNIPKRIFTRFILAPSGKLRLRPNENFNLCLEG
jgi:hypothetical protein